MRIIDNEGKSIEVSDLEKAIKQAVEFTGYSHESPEWAEFDKNRKQYWSDILEKLKKIQGKKELDSYGCVKCQERHYECDKLYEEHLKHQSKHSVVKFPNPYILT